jgi:hypothetical protein
MHGPPKDKGRKRPTSPAPQVKDRPNKNNRTALPQQARKRARLLALYAGWMAPTLRSRGRAR